MINKELKFKQSLNIEKVSENNFELSVIESKETQCFCENNNTFEEINNTRLYLTKNDLEDLYKNIENIIQKN